MSCFWVALVGIGIVFLFYRRIRKLEDDLKDSHRMLKYELLDLRNSWDEQIICSSRSSTQANASADVPLSNEQQKCQEEISKQLLKVQRYRSEQVNAYDAEDSVFASVNFEIAKRKLEELQERSNYLRINESAVPGYIYNVLSYKKIVVVDLVRGCDPIVEQLQRDCSALSVLGLDCEWISDGLPERVALLALASYTGLCALFRLDCIVEFPSSLRVLLEDSSITKVGVGPKDDAEKLAKNYNVNVKATLDLRLLANTARFEPCSLAKLSKQHLNVQLDKDRRIRDSNWEAFELTERQKKYAAEDALAGLKIYQVLLRKIKMDGNFHLIVNGCLLDEEYDPNREYFPPPKRVLE